MMNSERKRVYIAGPIRTSGAFMENVGNAVRAAEAIAAAGHVPFVPHAHNMLWDLLFPKTKREWVELDVEWVEACDALVRLDGESQGADIEVEHALNNSIDVFYGVEDFLSTERGGA